MLCPIYTALFQKDSDRFLSPSSLGLYYKLHGTHRPYSLKKTVIKRRKRVPAASGTVPNSSAPVSSGQTHTFVSQLNSNSSPSNPLSPGGLNTTMSDRDAAEALDALGKASRRSVTTPSGLQHDVSYDSEQANEPQRKKLRRTRSGSDRESSVEQLQTLHPESGERLTPHSWDAHGHSSSQHAGHPSQQQQQQQHHSPHSGHGGFDLPSLSELDVLSNHGHGHQISHPSHASHHAHLSGTARSFSYSGPSGSRRSPFSHSQGESGGSPNLNNNGTVQLPPLSHSHSHPFLTNMRGSPSPNQDPPSPAAVGSPMQQGHSPHHLAAVASSSSGASPSNSIPTYEDLNAHFNALHQERRRLENLLARTDDMLRAVKRGMEDMRVVSSSAGTTEPPKPSPQSQLQQTNGGANAARIPLRRRGSAGEVGSAVQVGGVWRIDEEKAAVQ